MKIVGFIAEYNPFHNGHFYHIQKALEVTEADAAIVVMSGDFVQRGAPAILPKRFRARAALECGVAAVFELPVCYATSSAELFALGAVSLLNQLGVVGSICFGSECGDLQILQQLADILCEEPAPYQDSLKEYLKKGLSFPAARQLAVSAYFAERHLPDCSSLLNEPNNILGIEYLKALKKTGSHMQPYTIQRMVSSYHDTTLQPAYSSASAIRMLLETTQQTGSAICFDELTSQIPACHLEFLKKEYCQSYPVLLNDFSLLLRCKLLQNSKTQLNEYQDVSEELANRIYNHQNEFINYSQFGELLKTRELAQTRIFRALLHIVLDIKEKDVQQYLADGIHYYARVLGFREDSVKIVSEIAKEGSLPLLTQPGRCELLPPAGRQMLMTDLFASNLYQSVITDKYHAAFENEYSKAIIKV